MARRLCALTVLTLAALRSADAQAVTRDSAGVRIVETRVRGAVPVAFTVSAKPTVDFGGESGDTLSEFFAPVGGVARMSDGRFIVALGMPAQTVRWYDRSGRYESTLARRGQGPGELSFAPRGLVVMRGDTVAFLGNRRVAFQHVTGRHWHTEAYRSGTPDGIFEGGTVLLAQRVSSDSSIVYRRVPRVRGEVSTDSGVRIAVGSTRSTVALQLRAPTGAVSATFVRPLPFARALRVAVAGDNVIMGDGALYEIREQDASGRIVRIIRRDADLTVRPAHIAAYRESVLVPGLAAEVRQLHERWLNELEYPKAMSAYQELFVDRVGRIWAREHPTTAGGPVPWSVFARDGAFLGVVQVPDGLTVKDIGTDYIVGVRRDADGFHHVQMRSLLPTR